MFYSKGVPIEINKFKLLFTVDKFNPTSFMSNKKLNKTPFYLIIQYAVFLHIHSSFICWFYK